MVTPDGARLRDRYLVFEVASHQVAIKDFIRGDRPLADSGEAGGVGSDVTDEDVLLAVPGEIGQ